MIVGILGPGGCGGTFLDWSLHYLAGNETNILLNYQKDNRSVINIKSIEKIVSNPINGTTAHRHLKTHPNSESLPTVIKLFSESPSGLHTFYFVDDMKVEQKQTYYNNIIDRKSHV